MISQTHFQGMIERVVERVFQKIMVVHRLSHVRGKLRNWPVVIVVSLFEVFIQSFSRAEVADPNVDDLKVLALQEAFGIGFGTVSGQLSQLRTQ